VTVDPVDLIDPDTMSLAEQVALMPDDEVAALLDELVDPTGRRVDADTLIDAWWFWRRPSQLPPIGIWMVWLIMTGRGWGKTRTAAEWVLDRVETGLCKVGGLAGRTIGDVRSTMIEGESGLLACAHARGLRAEYIANVRRVRIYRGMLLLAELEIFSSDAPDGPRGRNFDTVWADELAAWFPKVGQYGVTCWDNLILTLRTEDRAPAAVVTTTPKPVQVLRDLVQQSYVRITSGTIYENAANLDDNWMRTVVGAYEGTRLAAQELHGELLLQVEGALWTQDAISADRWLSEPGPRIYTALGVDPPGEGGECGIVVAAVYQTAPTRYDAAILADYSRRGPPDGPHGWAAAILQAVRDWRPDSIEVETNYGGQMVVSALRAAGIMLEAIPVHEIKVKDGKRIRTEAWVLLSDQHRVHNVGDNLVMLEGQQTGWDPEDPKAPSPDRIDAAVHALEPLRRWIEPKMPRKPRQDTRSVRTRTR
jgi:phage terminase large subunit-like protein